MKTLNLKTLAAAAALALSFAAAPAIAASVVDQAPIPFTGTNTPELLVQSTTVTGGTLYTSTSKDKAGNAVGVASTFVPSTAGGGYTRWLDLTAAKLDSGLPTSSTSAPSGTNFAVSRTAGTSLALIGGATSASAVTTKAMWEFNTASTYVAGSALPIVVNANYTGGGTVTAASTTLTVNVYTEVNGVETALTGITAAQQFTGTAANYTFTVPATAGLVVGQHLTVEVTMLVTTSAGAATGQINAIGATN